jgi:hypothetical protein
MSIAQDAVSTTPTLDAATARIVAGRSDTVAVMAVLLLVEGLLAWAFSDSHVSVFWNGWVLYGLLHIALLSWVVRAVVQFGDVQPKELPVLATSIVARAVAVLCGIALAAPAFGGGIDALAFVISTLIVVPNAWKLWYRLGQWRVVRRKPGA